jgi:hypothetical protein
LFVGREDVACYRLYAANCIELAQQVVDPDRRVFLFRMAQAWTHLAKQAEEHVRAEGQDVYSTGQPEPPSCDESVTPQSK